MLKPNYQVRSGCSFRVSATQVKSGGDKIYLAEDVAIIHADKIEAIPDDVQSSSSDAVDHEADLTGH